MCAWYVCIHMRGRSCSTVCTLQCVHMLGLDRSVLFHTPLSLGIRCRSLSRPFHWHVTFMYTSERIKVQNERPCPAHW